MARSLETMIDSAIEDTITIAAAADNPPIIVSSVTARAPALSGSESTVMSRSITPSANVAWPAIASGTTKMLIATR